MGPAEYPCTRIGLQMCVDGIPAFAANTFSLKPLEFMNLSLPPSIRGKAHNMLLLMLLPTSLKGPAQKKFYDFAAKYELNDLHHAGVLGVKVKVFSASMDTKGREELLGMLYALMLIRNTNCMICCMQECKPARRTRVVQSVYMRGPKGYFGKDRMTATAHFYLKPPKVDNVVCNIVVKYTNTGMCVRKKSHVTAITNSSRQLLRWRKSTSPCWDTKACRW